MCPRILRGRSPRPSTTTIAFASWWRRSARSIASSCAGENPGKGGPCATRVHSPPLPSIRAWVPSSSPICSPTGGRANEIGCALQRPAMNPKITAHHHSKPAYVYLRQSTPGQVRHHQESTERQYALREKAQELGWSEAAIRNLDGDLGISGSQIAGRQNFKTFLVDFSMMQKGTVFALTAALTVRPHRF